MNGILASANAVETAVTTGLTGIGTQITGIITVVLPIALGIVGAIMVVKFGIRFFRTLVG